MHMRDYYVMKGMNYTKARTKPTSFLALTSVTVSLFDEILPFFEEAHDEYFRWHNVKGKRIARQRAYSIPANSPLPTVADRLFFILVYLKNNPLQEYHAAYFGMSQQQCGDWIHSMKNILHTALGNAEMLPALDLASFKRLLDERGGDTVVHELIHDGTEREIPRPSDPDLQKEYYSGKKKKHTVKNAVITCMAGIILFVSLTVEGKVHDKRIADEHYSFPYESILQQDTGYQGYMPDNVTVVQPMKKPRGKELTSEQKAANREISRTRIKVEHAIGGAKTLRVVKDECRLRKGDFVGEIFHVAAGLHNWRVKFRS